MLNNEQLKVVNHIYGPAAVLSGAGSGKTTTLINRIEHLVNISGIAKLPVAGGITLVAISVGLTMLAGLIPAKFAAKRDPVEALRSE